MRRNLIRAAVWVGLSLSAGRTVLANALNSQLQPVASRSNARRSRSMEGKRRARY